MRLEDYFKKYPHCRRPESRRDKTFGNYSFITELFFPIWGERGLNKLESEFNFSIRLRVNLFLKNAGIRIIAW